MRVVVGAYRVCMQCHRRGAWTSCPACRSPDEVLDLATDEGRRAYALRRSLRGAGRGRRWLTLRAFRALPAGQKVLWLGGRVSLVCGTVLGAQWLTRHMPVRDGFGVALTWLTRGLLALVAGGSAMLLFLSTVLTAVVSLAALAGLVGLAASLLVRVLRSAEGEGEVTAVRWPARAAAAIERFEAGLLRRTLTAIEGFFLGRLRVDEALPRAATGPLRGVLSIDESEALWLDESASLELRDLRGLKGTLALEDGERVRVVLDAGSVELPEAALGEAQEYGLGAPVPLALLMHGDTPGVRRTLRASRWVVTVQGGERSESLEGGTQALGYRHVPTVQVLTGSVAQPLALKLHALAP